MRDKPSKKTYSPPQSTKSNAFSRKTTFISARKIKPPVGKRKMTMLMQLDSLKNKVGTVNFAEAARKIR